MKAVFRTGAFGLVVIGVTALSATPAQAAVIACDDQADYHVTVELLGEEYAEVCASRVDLHDVSPKLDAQVDGIIDDLPDPKP